MLLSKRAVHTWDEAISSTEYATYLQFVSWTGETLGPGIELGQYQAARERPFAAPFDGTSVLVARIQGETAQLSRLDETGVLSTLSSFPVGGAMFAAIIPVEAGFHAVLRQPTDQEIAFLVVAPSGEVKQETIGHGWYIATIRLEHETVVAWAEREEVWISRRGDDGARIGSDQPIPGHTFWLTGTAQPSVVLAPCPQGELAIALVQGIRISPPLQSVLQVGRWSRDGTWVAPPTSITDPDRAQALGAPALLCAADRIAATWGEQVVEPSGASVRLRYQELTLAGAPLTEPSTLDPQDGLNVSSFLPRFSSDAPLLVMGWIQYDGLQYSSRLMKLPCRPD